MNALVLLSCLCMFAADPVAGDTKTVQASDGLVPVVKELTDTSNFYEAITRQNVSALKGMFQKDRLRFLKPGTEVEIVNVIEDKGHVQKMNFAKIKASALLLRVQEDDVSKEVDFYLVPMHYLRDTPSRKDLLMPIFSVDIKMSIPIAGRKRILYTEDPFIVGTEDAYGRREVDKFIKARDKKGLAELFVSGQALKLEKMTPVLIIEADGKDGPVECRILAGPHKDKKLFVPPNTAGIAILEVTKDRSRK